MNVDSYILFKYNNTVTASYHTWRNFIQKKLRKYIF